LTICLYLLECEDAAGLGSAEARNGADGCGPVGRGMGGSDFRGVAGTGGVGRGGSAHGMARNIMKIIWYFRTMLLLSVYLTCVSFAPWTTQHKRWAFRRVYQTIRKEFKADYKARWMESRREEQEHQKKIIQKLGERLAVTVVNMIEAGNHRG